VYPISIVLFDSTRIVAETLYRSASENETRARHSWQS
jgi:hypothetical protein